MYGQHHTVFIASGARKVSGARGRDQTTQDTGNDTDVGPRVSRTLARGAQRPKVIFENSLLCHSAAHGFEENAIQRVIGLTRVKRDAFRNSCETLTDPAAMPPRTSTRFILRSQRTGAQAGRKAAWWSFAVVLLGVATRRTELIVVFIDQRQECRSRYDTMGKWYTSKGRNPN